jgi:hypothetical protein
METIQRGFGAALTSAAHLALSQWINRIGTTGLPAMRALPALVAAVDQHAAHVRDALADRSGRLRLAHLAAYADGVADTAARWGWTWPDRQDTDWQRASWPSVRLLAVCMLAEHTATAG